ncbi:MAG: hypothetical protein HQM16_10805 [Deltaproteobacteria bacterium]|nr:hypothetical protein [Deltaproteobacteria bacterium]
MSIQETKALEGWNYGLQAALHETLVYAKKNIAYYSKTLPRRIVCDGNCRILKEIPVINKKVVAMNHRGFCRSYLPLNLGYLSSGTTLGKGAFFEVKHTKEEEYAKSVFLMTGGDWSAACDSSNWCEEKIQALRRRYYSRTDKGPPVRSLVIADTHQAIPKIPQGDRVVKIAWHHHPNVINRISYLLQLPADQGRFVYLKGPPGILIKMSLLLQERGFDFSKCSIRMLGVFGYLSARWRRWLEALWNRPIVEVFTMSEFPSFAKECVDGGHYHFDELPLITEVLDPLTNKNISSGIGEFVFTSLYPFTQEQPFIRYATGDLVKIVPCRREKTLGFRWMGRKHNSVIWNRKNAPEGIVAMREVNDILDNYPEVQRSSDVFEDLKVFPQGTVGWPLFRMTLDGSKQRCVSVIIHVSLNHLPCLYPGLVREIGTAVNKGLCSCNRDIKRALGQKKLDIQTRFYGPDEDLEGLKAWYEWDVFLGSKISKDKKRPRAKT